MDGKIIIGRTEYIDFLDLDIHNISAKIDTGAYTSSVRCEYTKEDQEKGILYFKLLSTKNYPNYANIEHHTTDYRRKRIKSSSGVAEYRYIIKVKVLFCGKKYTTEFSLTKRLGLRSPVLIGRKFLTKRFIVDTQLTNTHENSHLI